MSIQELDYWFPFVVFFYGFFLTVVLHTPRLVKLGKERLPQAEWRRFESHKGLALFSLVLGGLWSLQHLLIS